MMIDPLEVQKVAALATGGAIAGCLAWSQRKVWPLIQAWRESREEPLPGRRRVLRSMSTFY